MKLTVRVAFVNRTTKCELAKVLNRETCYKSIIHKRDTLILKLDEKVSDLEVPMCDKRKYEHLIFCDPKPQNDQIKLEMENKQWNNLLSDHDQR